MNLTEKWRIKLRKWLLREEDEEFARRMDAFNNEIETCKSAIQTVGHAIDVVTDCQKFMNSMIDVGVDINHLPEEHSWAVVCIKGKPEYVKFIPLQHQNAKEVLDFLKQFQYSNKVIDSPIEFKRMFEHEIMKKPFE